MEYPLVSIIILDLVKRLIHNQTIETIESASLSWSEVWPGRTISVDTARNRYARSTNILYSNRSVWLHKCQIKIQTTTVIIPKLAV